MDLSFIGIKISGKQHNFVFLIVMAPSRITLLNFEKWYLDHIYSIDSKNKQIK
jgi:hypothetical protein